MYTFLIVTGAFILFTLLVFIIASYMAYRYVFARSKKREPALYKGLDGTLTPERAKKRSFIERLSMLPYEDIYVTASDGVRLYARYYRGENDAPIAIGFHGYRSASVRDLAGLTLDYLSRGFGVLLVDQRAHGKSGGRAITFGEKERFDLLSWLDFATNTIASGKKIILFGMSMGAGTVMLGSELSLPENVRGAVLDCPFSSASDIIKKVCREKGFPPRIAYPVLRFGARLYGGFSLSKRTPLDAVKFARIPILLIHGAEDSFVPSEMSDALYEAGKDVSYLKIKGAGHLMSMMYDEDGYKSAHTEFLKKVL